MALPLLLYIATTIIATTIPTLFFPLLFPILLLSSDEKDGSSSVNRKTKTDKYTCMQTDRQTDRQANRQTYRSRGVCSETVDLGVIGAYLLSHSFQVEIYKLTQIPLPFQNKLFQMSLVKVHIERSQDKKTTLPFYPCNLPNWLRVAYNWVQARTHAEIASSMRICVTLTSPLQQRPIDVVYSQ